MAQRRLLHLAGALLGAAVALGLCSGAAMLVLWLLYFSVVTMAEGSSFYQYGWESQLLETGVIAAFLCGPSRRRPPSFAILLLMRWLCFRISIGAGLIKIRGGSCCPLAAPSPSSAPVLSFTLSTLVGKWRMPSWTRSPLPIGVPR